MCPLEFNIRFMRFLILWPNNQSNTVTKGYLMKHTMFLLTLLPSASTCFLGLCHQLNKLEDINILVDHVISLGALSACTYMCECFMRNFEKVNRLADEISSFGKEFGAEEVIQKTDKQVQTYTKGIMLYGVIGNMCYAIFPLLTISECEASRASPELTRQRDPCGLIVRVWYPFDISSSLRFPVAYLLQMYTCIVITVLVLALTMFLVGLLMHAVALLKDCGERVRTCCDVPDDRMKQENVRLCVRYHIAIILYSSNVTQAFSAMMLTHLTLTSFEISVLGFEVVVVGQGTDSLRFGMHLFGWMFLLLLICLYGQNLVDESTMIGEHAYASSWYNSPIGVQKDLQLMIMRSQKPLTLSAASLGVMSLTTYLGVMKTAYSYFTLLVNVKDS